MGKVASKQVDALNKQISQLAESQKLNNEKLNEIKTTLEAKIETLEKKVGALENKPASSNDGPDEIRQNVVIKDHPLQEVNAKSIEENLHEKLKLLVEKEVTQKSSYAETKTTDAMKVIKDQIAGLQTQIEAKLANQVQNDNAADSSEIDDKVTQVEEKLEKVANTQKQFVSDLSVSFETAVAAFVVNSYFTFKGLFPLCSSYSMFLQLSDEHVEAYNTILEDDYASWNDLPNAVIEGPEGMEVISASEFCPALSPRGTELKLFGLLKPSTHDHARLKLKQFANLKSFATIDHEHATAFFLFEAATNIDFILNEDGSPANSPTTVFIARLLSLEKSLAALSVHFDVAWDKFISLVEVGLIYSGGCISGESPGMLDAFLDSSFSQYVPRLLDVIKAGNFVIVGPNIK